MAVSSPPHALPRLLIPAALILTLLVGAPAQAYDFLVTSRTEGGTATSCGVTNATGWCSSTGGA